MAAHDPIIQPYLPGNVEDGVLPLKLDHDFFDGAVEFPILAFRSPADTGGKPPDSKIVFVKC